MGSDIRCIVDYHKTIFHFFFFRGFAASPKIDHRFSYEAILKREEREIIIESIGWWRETKGEREREGEDDG